jgi:hypothetical protein
MSEIYTIKRALLDAHQQEVESLRTISNGELKELQGCIFSSSVVIPSLEFGGIIRNRIHSAVNRFTHFKSLLFSLEGGSCSIKIYRDVTVNDAGTEIPNIYKNINHVSTNTPETKGFQNSTYSSADLFRTVIAHGSSSNQAVSGTSFVQLAYDSLTCKKDNDYFLEIQNIDEDQKTAYLINIIGTIYEVNYALLESCI